MLSNVFTFYLVVLVTQALCAFAIPSAGPMYNPTPTPTTTIEVRSQPEMENWRAVLKRNLHEMLAPRQENKKDNSKFRPVAWNEETSEVCSKKLKDITKASNPVGLAVCYNIASFNRTNWSFFLDLRLYKVSAPDKDWETISNDVEVVLTYEGAKLSEANLGPFNNTSKDGPQFFKGFHFFGMVLDPFRKENASEYVCTHTHNQDFLSNSNGNGNSND